VHIADDTHSHSEQKNLRWFMREIKECDGYALFSNKRWAGYPITELPIKEGSWGHNMGHLMKSWDYLLHKTDISQYDWVLNLEMDHIMRAPQVKELLHNHLAFVENGRAKSSQPPAPHGAMMLEWGNVFLFNRPMVGEMRRQWGLLNRTLPVNATSEGCPAWKVGLADWPLCVQDIDYRLMARRIMRPPVPTYGTLRCNRPICSLNGVEDVWCKNGQMVVPCVSLNLKYPLQLTAIENISRRDPGVNSVVLRHVSGMPWNLVNTFEPDWLNRTDLRQTPLYHAVHNEDVYERFNKSFAPLDASPP